MDKSTEEHVVIGSFVFNVFKDAVMLGNEDQVYLFRSEIRAMLHAMYRETFDLSNKLVEFPYHNGSDNRHRMNKIGIAFLEFLEMHLVQYGDRAVANISGKISFMDNAVLGMVSNIKSWNIIEDQSKDRTSKIMVFDVKDILQLGTLEYAFTNTVWAAFEDELISQNGKIVFYGSGDGLPYDPIAETQIKVYLWGLKEVYELQQLYEVYLRMTNTIEYAKRASQQLVADLKTEMNKVLSLVKRMSRAISGEIEIIDSKLTHISNKYDEVLEKEVILRNALDENGAIGEIVSAFELLVEETSRIGTDLDIIESRYNKVTGLNLRIDKKIKAISVAAGKSKEDVMKLVLAQNITETEDAVIESVEALSSDNGKSRFQKFMRNS